MSDRGSRDQSRERATSRSARWAPSSQVGMREAFLEWLDASREWSSLQRSIETGRDLSSATRQKIKTLEMRMNVAAEAFERAPRVIGSRRPLVKEATDKPAALGQVHEPR